MIGYQALHSSSRRIRQDLLHLREQRLIDSLVMREIDVQRQEFNRGERLEKLSLVRVEKLERLHCTIGLIV